jgi:hypothetical protein
MTIKINVDLGVARDMAARLVLPAERQCIYLLCEEVERLYAEAVNAKQAEESMGRMATGAELQALREWIDREFKSTRDDIAASFKARDEVQTRPEHLEERIVALETEGKRRAAMRTDRAFFEARSDAARDLAAAIARAAKGPDADSSTFFLPGLGTLNPCVDCGCVVAGGPTRCADCARGNGEVIRLDSRLAEVESEIRVHLQGHQLSARGGGSSLEESRVDRILHDHERQKEAFLAMQKRLAEVEDLAERIADRQAKGEQVVGGRLNVLEAAVPALQRQIDVHEMTLTRHGEWFARNGEMDDEDRARIEKLEAGHAQRDAWIARAEAHDLNKIEESIEALDTRMVAVEEDDQSWKWMAKHVQHQEERLKGIENMIGSTTIEVRPTGMSPAHVRINDLSNALAATGASLGQRIHALEHPCGLPADTSDVKVNIHRIEVACDDPDRFAFGMADALKKEAIKRGGGVEAVKALSLLREAAGMWWRDLDDETGLQRFQEWRDRVRAFLEGK